MALSGGAGSLLGLTFTRDPNGRVTAMTDSAAPLRNASYTYSDAGRLAPNLYADLRAAWGTSDNTISPLGTDIDPFENSRAHYSGSLIGQFPIGGATEFRPEIAFRHLDEKQKPYVDSFGVVIPGQTVGQGDISFRPR